MGDGVIIKYLRGFHEAARCEKAGIPNFGGQGHGMIVPNRPRACHLGKDGMTAEGDAKGEDELLLV